MDLKSKIRVIEDFPQKGISFKDITTLLNDGEAFHEVISRMADYCRGRNVEAVVGVESRGFLFGAPLAYELGLGFTLIRKPGKLPAETLKVEYDLEYGKDALEIHTDAIAPGQRVVIVDDLLATGGTISAAAQLVERVGGEIAGFLFVIELESLGGRKKLEGYDVFSLVKYDR